MSNTSDERTYIDLRDSLGCTNQMERPSRNDFKLKLTTETKIPLMRKMRLRVWGYKNGEYLYMLHGGSLILKYKTYSIKSLDDALEAWKELILNMGFGIWVVEKDKREAFYLFLGQ